jgi:hypothetical protein
LKVCCCVDSGMTPFDAEALGSVTVHQESSAFKGSPFMLSYLQLWYAQYNFEQIDHGTCGQRAMMC